MKFRTYTIFEVAGTPVNTSGMVVGNVLVLWVLAAWVGARFHPGRTWLESLLIGFLAMALLLIADFGHAIAHIFSARSAGAPMDEVLISTGMPRTIYNDNDVPPAIHRKRAMGGPIFSLCGLVISLGLYFFIPDGSILRELAGWSSIGHAFILLGSLAPLPFVDGGTLLKWTMVGHGFEPGKADRTIRQVDTVIGIVSGIAAVFLLLMGEWLWCLIAVGVLVIFIGAGSGKIR